MRLWLQTCVDLLGHFNLSKLNTTLDTGDQYYFEITSFTVGVASTTGSFSTFGFFAGSGSGSGSFFCILFRFGCCCCCFFCDSFSTRFFRSISIFSRSRSRSSSSDFAASCHCEAIKLRVVGVRGTATRISASTSSSSCFLRSAILSAIGTS